LRPALLLSNCRNYFLPIESKNGNTRNLIIRVILYWHEARSVTQEKSKDLGYLVRRAKNI